VTNATAPAKVPSNGATRAKENMPHQETIEIVVGTEGDVTVEAKGFKGKSCMDATKQIEKALGVTGKDSKTGEYYEKPKVGVKAGA
jgi:hypothetical protein